MEQNEIIVWLILGAIAGWAAGKLLRGKGLGILGNIVVGILGSFLGGWLAPILGIKGAVVGGLGIPSILTAIGGAAVLLVVVDVLKRSN